MVLTLVDRDTNINTAVERAVKSVVLKCLLSKFLLIYKNLFRPVLFRSSFTLMTSEFGQYSVVCPHCKSKDVIFPVIGPIEI